MGRGAPSEPPLLGWGCSGAPGVPCSQFPVFSRVPHPNRRCSGGVVRVPRAFPVPCSLSYPGCPIRAGLARVGLFARPRRSLCAKRCRFCFCIRARLQSCRTAVKIRRALAPARPPRSACHPERSIRIRCALSLGATKNSGREPKDLHFSAGIGAPQYCDAGCPISARCSQMGEAANPPFHDPGCPIRAGFARVG
jgi:hypothetical protein